MIHKARQMTSDNIHMDYKSKNVPVLEEILSFLYLIPSDVLSNIF